MVTLTGRVLGLPREQACAVLQVAAGLSDPEVYLLILMRNLSKSDDARILHETELAGRPSFEGPLLEIGQSVLLTLQALERDGMIAPEGRHKFRGTPEGNKVKHLYFALWLHLRIHGGVPSSGLSLESVRSVRESMARYCSTGNA